MTEAAADRLELEAAAHELEVRLARRSSSAFVDGLFGFRSAPFQVAWHRALDEFRRIVLWAPIEHGKTQQITLGYPVWRLGRNPKERGLLVGNTASQAEKSLSVVRRLIEESEFVREVFPGLRRGRGKWSDSAINVEGADVTQKEYSLQAVGINGPILGARCTFAILDDILDFENTYTAGQRQKVTKWVKAVLLGRMVAGSTVIVTGNAWFPDDAMHELASLGFHVIRDEAYAETADGAIIPESILWPEQWPLSRLEGGGGELGKRKELGFIEARRQLRCMAYQQGQGQFRLEWFDRAFELGKGARYVPAGGRYTGEHGPCFIGVDLGVKEKEQHDKTALWAIAVHPKTGRRRLLRALEDRMDGPKIVETIVAWYHELGGSVMVENNAAQDYIRQFTRAEGVPVEGFTTGKSKADPAFGVPSMAVELEQALWELPPTTEAFSWRTQCLNYAPGEHTGDLLMASWFAREAARLGIVGQTETVEASTTKAKYGNLRARYGVQGRRG